MLRIALAGVGRRTAGCPALLCPTSATARVVGVVRNSALAPATPQQRSAAFSLLSGAATTHLPSMGTVAGRSPSTPLLSADPRILAACVFTPPSSSSVRTVTKFSLRKGKRKSVKPVVKRFMRLEWGGWIRTRQGRHKKMWRKTGDLKRRLRQHVFVNATQAHLLDKMVTPFWRRPRHYVDDPYRPYHSREEFAATRQRPVKW